MAGHSKWSKIKRFKGVLDAKRGRVFAKLSKEITVATKIGGGNPDMNPRLRLALLKCRDANMPSENIERAIKKGTGGGEDTNFEELTYEVYGPNGVAILVEITTDNRNRAAAEMRSLLSKNGASLATSGSVSRLFNRKGQLIISREAANEDKVMEAALEAGAEDFKADSEGYEILTDPADFESVHKAIEARGLRCDAAQVTSIPMITVPLNDPSASSSLSKLIEALEDHDDVREVHSNAEFADETG
ncbi:MAG: YebC/PmpR family DNA-binding transcriptional regulator [Verrucomicrobia bacterium]|nr:YebC/PmpR family DNA-binding transcriptional regulator [Verrucomicrobiota bacterium]